MHFLFRNSWGYSYSTFRIKVQAFAFCKAVRQLSCPHTRYTALLFSIRGLPPLLVSAGSRNMFAGPVLVPPRCGMCKWSVSYQHCYPTWSSFHLHPHPGRGQEMYEIHMGGKKRYQSEIILMRQRPSNAAMSWLGEPRWLGPWRP